jgi:AcrR family transcriptional regulator
VRREESEISVRRVRKARDPEESRRALVEAAAELFNTVGFHGTDTNRIAKAAGYTPGTFYTHFVDKRAIFLEVYKQWVDTELVDIAAGFQSRGPERRERLAKTIVEHHRRWKTFRASLRALYAIDDEVRRERLVQRTRQVDLMIKLMRDAGREPLNRARIYANLLTVEMICDAIADGDIKAMGIRETDMFQVLLDNIGRPRG